MRLSTFGNTQQVGSQQINKQQGFTLIELVVVIVILGILAVTAAPKFIDLQDDARTATLNAVKASVQSVATLVHSKSLITGNQGAASGQTVSVNGADVHIRFGYPRDNSAAALANWQDDLLDVNDGFTITRQNGAIIIVPEGIVLSGSWPADPANPQSNERNCYFRYQESDVAGDPPLVIQTVPCL